VERLETELGLCWPREAEPVRTVRPAGVDNYNGAPREVEGYDFNVHTCHVDRMWSTQTSHGRFYDGKRTSGTQGTRSLFATEREAAVAMRWAICREMAAKLHRVDEFIAGLS
jgi:hypothetical protein